MQLFYHSQVNEGDKTVGFDKDESKHLAKVLRMQSGDLLELTNGRGLWAQARLTQVSPSSCQAEILQAVQHQASKVHLHLAVAPTKMMDRMEWFLEKATEIGLQEFTPVICEHSERKVLKIDRLQKIALSAMKQSKQYFLPKINEAVTLKQFLENPPMGDHFIAHCQPEQKLHLKECVRPGQPTLILIGPEGDFSNTEITLALQKKFKPISLGETRLRTETAALVACHTVVLCNTLC